MKEDYSKINIENIIGVFIYNLYRDLEMTWNLAILCALKENVISFDDLKEYQIHDFKKGRKWKNYI